MENKEVFVLSDPDKEPEQELLKKLLADRWFWLNSVLDHARTRRKAITEEWKYYQDARQWLFRITSKKETICWIGILHETFRITFYFSRKYETAIEKSDLPEIIKESWRQTEGKTFRPVSIKMEQEEDIDLACKLIDLKLLQ